MVKRVHANKRSFKKFTTLAEEKRKQYEKRIVWREANPELYLYKSCKYRAREKNIPFNLELHDIIVPAICPVLGISIFSGRNGITNNSPNIDRIIPELGYIKGNIIVVSSLANRIKANATPEQILKVALFYKELIKKSNKRLKNP